MKKIRKIKKVAVYIVVPLSGINMKVLFWNKYYFQIKDDKVYSIQVMESVCTLVQVQAYMLEQARAYT